MSAEGREPYGLDHVGPYWPTPKLWDWKQAVLEEHENGLRAAVWTDLPYNLRNALAPLLQRERQAEAAGQLDLFELPPAKRAVNVPTGAFL